MVRMIIILVVFVLFYGVISISFTSAAEQVANLSIREQATNYFNESKNIFYELTANNFSVQRANDSLKQVEDAYNAQILLKTQGRSNDFSRVIDYCEQIKMIRDNAFLSRDEITALMKFYDEIFEEVEGLNTTSVDMLFAEINNEIDNERYEKVPDLVNKAYDEIVKVQSENTTLKLFYKSTARGIMNFIAGNWIILSSLIIGGIVLFVFYKKAIYHWIINRKISMLELRKQTLKKMIMQAQLDYFQHGKMSDGDYSVKTKKLAELIRDIDRQIPLLREELAKIGEMGEEKKE